MKTLAPAGLMTRPCALTCSTEIAPLVGATTAATDLLIVMRTSGERTSSAAAASWQGQLGSRSETRFRLMCERPGAGALGTALELGRQSGLIWVVVADASVLPSERALSMLTEACARAQECTAAVVGPVWDKFDGRSHAGVVAYRVDFAEDILRVVEPFIGATGAQRRDQAEATDGEVAATVAEALREHGLGIEQTDALIGIRGHEQAYLHIYMRMRRLARRAGASADDAERVRSRKRRFDAAYLSQSDRDYQAAAWGIEDGLAEGGVQRARGRAAAGSFTPWPGFDRRMLEGDFREKRPLDEQAVVGLADRVLADRTPSSVLTAARVDMAPVERRVA